MRNALVAPDTDVDCLDFTDWPAAADACNQLLNGTAPAERKEARPRRRTARC